MSTASQLFNTALRSYRSRQAFRKHALAEIPDQNICRPLTAEQKREVDALWSPLWHAPSYRWHEFFYGLTGTFDAHYLPADIHFMKIVPALNNIDLRKAWEDKAYYVQRFPDTRFPETLGYCVHGQLLSDAYEACEADQLLKRFEPFDEVLIKPTLDTFCGKGVEIFNPATLDSAGLMEMCQAREGDCVFQVPVQQHDVLAAFNPSSCNIIRINTLRVDTTIQILNATIRFGDTGTRTDVWFDENGVERLNLIGIDSEGHLMDTAFTAQAQPIPIETYGLSAGIAVPGFAEACESCKQVHLSLQHFNLAAFDVTIDAQGAPVVIEVNLGMPGCSFYQFMHGPFFGSHTEDVIAFVREHI